MIADYRILYRLYRGVVPGTENLTTPFVKTIFSSPQTFQVPISEQGTLYPFVPIPVSGNGGLFGNSAHLLPNQTETFYHICHQSQYTIFSPEELRLADYRLNRKYQGDLPTATAVPATVAAPPPQPAVGGLFGNAGAGPSIFAQPASQPTPPPATFSFGPLGNQASSSASTGLFAQLNANQQPNMFASRYGPIVNPQSSNPLGVAPASQPQNLFGGVSNSTSHPPNSNIFGGPVPPASQTQGLFSGLGNSTPGPSSNSLFASASTANPFAPSGNSTSQSPSSSLFGVPAAPTNSAQNPLAGLSNGSAPSTNQTHNIFASLNNSASQAPPAPALSTSLFGTATPQRTGGGLFGNMQPQNTGGLFGGSVMQSNRSQGFGNFGSQFPIYDATTSLPPGAALITVRPQKPKPGEFGYYSSIKHSKSPGQFINGIPRGDPLDESFIDLEKQQLALLNLCIMAETFCWPTLFNDAINVYIRGEHKLQRPITLDFIDRIYARTHPGSTLRVYVLDSISRIKSDGVEDITPYMNMAHKHEDFLADLLDKIMGSNQPLNDVTEKTVENYQMWGMGDDNDNENTNYDGEGDQHTGPNDIL